jgi:opacity protein-like surface antigen
MRKRLGISVIALTFAIGFVGRAEAQRRRGLVDVGSYDERHGFWLNLGIGAGQEQSKFADENNWSDALTKPTGSIIIGGTVNPNLRLGVQLNGWADTHYDAGAATNVTDYLGGLLLVGQFYPSRRAGFYLKGGAGFSRVGTDVPGPGGIHEDGFGWTAGAGYELRLSRNLFLTPMADFYQHRSDTRDVSGVLQPALYDRLITVGVALTIQSGRR